MPICKETKDDQKAQCFELKDAVRCPYSDCHTPALSGYLAPGSKIEIKCRRCKRIFKVKSVGE